MDLVLYPRAAPGDRLRVWAGSFRRAQAPELTWWLDGQPATPRALRPISSVRSGDALPKNTPPASVPRAFAGVYEFANLQPDTRHEITVQADGERASWSLRTLPTQVPNVLDRWFNVLLVSCFYQGEDVQGVAGTVISELKGAAQPHLTLLVGDQVYLDLPTQVIFPAEPDRLADKFEADYRRNWAGPGGFGQVLAAAPSACIPDDHEYWNNFPNATPVVANTWTAGGRAAWQLAARQLFEGFQRSYDGQLGDAFTLDVAPLSFFLADGRTFRDPDRRFMLSRAGRDQLDAWAQRVIDGRLFGVFVSGQSLFSEPAGFFTGKIADYEMPNYQDFPQIVRALTRIADAGRPVLCLTGDVHWGRVTEARDQISGRTAFREIIASPTSLVATLGADQVATARTWLGGLLGGTADPWPRHAAAQPAPAYFAGDVTGSRFACASPALHQQRGNHVVLLSFQQSGGGVDVRVTYYPLSLVDSIRKPIVVGPFRLRNL